MSVQGRPEGTPGMEGAVVDEDEAELRRALALSRQDMEVEDEEADLRRAIQLSMQGAACALSSQEPGGKSVEQPLQPSISESESMSAEELRRKRQAYFDRQNQPQNAETPADNKDVGSDGHNTQTSHT